MFVKHTHKRPPLKFTNQWYTTPVKIKSWLPQESDSCWRCNTGRGTFLHIWWSCPKIQTYWQMIIKWIKHITETKMDLDPACCLLHVNLLYRKYNKSLVRHLLSSAKVLIPLKGKTRHTPSIKDWRQSMKWKKPWLIRKTSTQFHKIWRFWYLFKLSEDYKTLTESW